MKLRAPSSQAEQPGSLESCHGPPEAIYCNPLPLHLQQQLRATVALKSLQILCEQTHTAGTASDAVLASTATVASRQSAWLLLQGAAPAMSFKGHMGSCPAMIHSYAYPLPQARDRDIGPVALPPPSPATTRTHLTG